MLKNETAFFLEKNYINAFKCIAVVGKSVWFERDFIGMDSGIDVHFMNGVLCSDFKHGEVEQRVNEILEFFKRKNRPFLWRIGGLTSNREELERVLIKKGFKAEGPMFGMILEKPLIDSNNNDLEVIQVRSESDFNEWIIPFQKGFDKPESVAPFFQKFNAKVGFGDANPFINFYGKIDGKPICTASAFIDSHFGSIFNVKTIPEYRRMGYGETVTKAAIRSIQGKGRFCIGLYSSKIAHSLYEKMGFVDLTKCDAYSWTPDILESM